VIPDGMVIGENAMADSERFFRSEKGITLVTQPMLEALSGQK
jgi:glucose-1-phosphate adenylyltransferase